ncbi:unnamed protein product [Notodromas monacha]|uniref:Otopetrin-2 n=1 Tax=Notodromas monacha TaxID=399045 RepID=A0A7R9BJB1_9CRUS|nr:unnamed protein product [Notodromas monacha]CAG0916537.1 unnamed protein product [Notodromas monacha]
MHRHGSAESLLLSVLPVRDRHHHHGDTTRQQMADDPWVPMSPCDREAGLCRLPLRRRGLSACDTKPLSLQDAIWCWVGLEPPFRHNEPPSGWKKSASNSQLPDAAVNPDENPEGTSEASPEAPLVPQPPPTPPPVLTSTELLSLEQDGGDKSQDPFQRESPIRTITMEEVEAMAVPDKEEEEDMPLARNSTMKDQDLPSEYPTSATILSRRPSSLQDGGGGGGGKDTPAVDPTTNSGIAMGLSAMYGKLLVVLGFAFPLSEVISSHIPYSFYEAFYLYLYIGCIVFLLFIYGEIMVTKKKSRMTEMRRVAGSTYSMESFYSVDPQSVVDPETGRVSWLDKPTIQYGSFYLRLGTVAFGVGNMIYSGLEVGQYFEYQEDDRCYTPLLAITPAFRIVFTFIQMYFIFLNSKMLISRFSVVARFGLMHMIATNLCIWLYVLVEESKHELLQGDHQSSANHHVPKVDHSFAGIPAVHHPHDEHHQHTSAGNESVLDTISNLIFGVEDPVGNGSTLFPEFLVVQANASASSSSASEYPHSTNNLVPTPLTLGLVGSGPHTVHECLRTNMMGELVQNASPFLFPCVIEYSLICAAVLYVMWKNVEEAGTDDARNNRPPRHRSGMLRISSKRSRHHYSMDCAGANRGLFTGIVLLVLTVISLILFFVLIGREDTRDVAVFEANVSELVLYAASAIAAMAGMVRMRRLRHARHHDLELDSILLIIAQTGLFLYAVFIVIGGYFALDAGRLATGLTLATGLLMLAQCGLQTMFIVDASRRFARNSAQARDKPGREFVTFLIVANLAMWAVNTLETSRASAHPVHLQFFGEWAWTVIVHVSMPLAIFYRFHSTVCLCEVWTKAYKVRHVDQHH